jgi:exopolysaccharide biosynthesis polyprenyl glycosylphosphotransferase
VVAGDERPSATPAAEPARDRPADERRLRLLLKAGDLAAVFVAFTVVLNAVGYQRFDPYNVTLAPIAAAVLGAWAIRFEGLWNERIIAMRWIELSKLTVAAGILGAAMLVLDRVFKLYIHIEQIVVACIVSWLLLVAWRSAYRAWLGLNRRNGRFTRRMVIIGTDRRAIELTKLFEIHPETGMRVQGLIGVRREAEQAGFGHLWLGGYADADDLLAETETETVVVCSADISPTLLNALVRDEQGRGRELYFHPGLSGIDARRVKAAPLAHEPLLYVESASLSKTDLALKRAFDIAVSAALLLLTSPILAVVAVLIKRHDRGPVLFRQQRVGQGDTEFGMLKFRTMVVDAEARLAALQTDNERSGPLFKLGVDPRVTPVGRFLRKTSLDELPQLINVLKGEMSLVGPRPALRAEVDEFPIELRQRHRVRPGITGLWQVEARDNPAFDAYQRLDLFYVENWSLALDLVIMLGTAEHMLLRPFLNRTGGEMAAPAAAATHATAA